MTHAHGSDGCRRHPAGGPGERSPEERLVIRLEHLLAHNRDHEAAYRKLSREAAGFGDPEAGRHIHKAGELVDAQNRELETALARLRSRFGLDPAKTP